MSKNVLRSQEKGGFADYSYYRHKREIRRCQINGGAVLDICMKHCLFLSIASYVSDLHPLR